MFQAPPAAEREAARRALEPADGPEASYAVLLKVPGGRIYAFYNHNTDNVREVKREDKGVYKRVDSLGHYVFKFSDDHGRSWSARRYDVPVREFACDRTNVYGGRLRFFWNVGRPLMLNDAAMLVLHKVGAMGNGFFAQSEGVFLRSKSILTESDPARIAFETPWALKITVLPAGTSASSSMNTAPLARRSSQTNLLCTTSWRT